jgi:hypothetical protein
MHPTDVEYGNGQHGQVDTCIDCHIEMDHYSADILVVISKDTPYDIVLGLDFLEEAEVKLNFAKTGLKLSPTKIMLSHLSNKGRDEYMAAKQEPVMLATDS